MSADLNEQDVIEHKSVSVSFLAGRYLRHLFPGYTNDLDRQPGRAHVRLANFPFSSNALAPIPSNPAFHYRLQLVRHSSVPRDRKPKKPALLHGASIPELFKSTKSMTFPIEGSGALDVRFQSQP